MVFPKYIVNNQGQEWPDFRYIKVCQYLWHELNGVVDRNAQISISFFFFVNGLTPSKNVW